MLARFVHTSGWIKQQWETPWVRRVFLVFIFSFIASLAVFLPANAIGPTLDDVTGWLAKTVFTFASFLVGILAWLISALITVAQYNNFIHDEGVIIGWTLVRDIANMFFVVVLLVIAFGTILGRDSYHMKNTLGRFVATAILINFSRLFLGIMIDLVQVIMMTFVNAIAQVGAGNFVQAFKVNDAFRVAQQVSGSAGDMLITAILSVILIAMAVYAIGQFALLLIYRMATLWVLIVMSPIAFLLGAIPSKSMGFDSYYQEWWGYLKGNLLIGPVAAFFIWLALAMVGDGNIFTKITSEAGSDTAEAAVTLNRPESGITDSAISSIENLSGFLIAFAVFMVALDMTKKVASTMGGGGGDWITSKTSSMANNIKSGNLRGLVEDIPIAGKAATATYDAAAKPFKEVYGAYAEEHGLAAKYSSGVNKGVDAVAARVGTQATRDTARGRIASRAADKRGKREEALGSSTSQELRQSWNNASPVDRVAMAKIMLERKDQMSPERLEQARASAERIGDTKGARDLMSLAGQNAAHAAAQDNLDSVDQAAEFLNRKDINQNSFDSNHLTDTQMDNVVQATLQERGTEGLKDLTTKSELRRTRDNYNDRMPSLVAQSVEGAAGSQEQIAQLDAQILTAEQNVQDLDRGEQAGRGPEQLAAEQANLRQFRDRRRELHSQAEAPVEIAMVHAQNTGRPDLSVGSLSGRPREVVLDHLVRDLKPNTINREAINQEVLGSARRVYGGKMGDWIKKLNPEQATAVSDAADRIEIADPRTTRNEAEAKILLRGDFTGLESRDDSGAIMDGAVSDMSSKQMAKVRLDTLQGGNMEAFLNAIRSNPRAVRGLNKVDGVSQALLDRIEVEVNNNYNRDSEGWGELKSTTDSWESPLGNQIRAAAQEAADAAAAAAAEAAAAQQSAAQQADDQARMAGMGGGDFDDVDLGAGDGDDLELDV